MTAGEYVNAVISALSTGKDYSRGISEWWKIWMAASGIALAVGWRWLPARAARAALLTLTLVAGVNYFRCGPKTPFERVDTYDLIHYYLNAKYFDELGYFDLYPACILADHEANGPYYDEGTKFMNQDLEHGHQLEPISVALSEGTQLKAEKFTPERWAAFSHDFLYLQRSLPGLSDEMWQQLIQDHGFNGTVVWSLEALPFTYVPVEYIKWICWVDVVLLAIGFGAVAWAFDVPTMLWGLLFLFVTYSTRWPEVTWALLRYDYIAALLLGIALVKRGRMFGAGLATAWAATLRFFPAMWLYGAGAKGVFSLFERKVQRQLLVLLGGFLVGAAVLQGVATVIFGADQVATHFENMEDHNSSENLSSRRIGLALALPFTDRMGPDTAPKALPKSEKVVIEKQKPLRFALAGALMLVLGWGLRKKSDEEGYAFGFLPFFLLTTASYYYYIARITLIVLHGANLSKPRHVVGMAWLLGLEVFCNWAETYHPSHRVFLIGWLAWGLFAYGVLMAVWTAIEAWREKPAALTP